MRILLLSKTTHWCKVAQRFARLAFRDVTIAEGERGDPLPESLEDWEGDCILSFLSSWIIPGKLLRQARVAAINFHPAPPEYPGIGCYNFAIYDGVSQYGVTCHRMEPKVDVGAIVQVQRFPLFPWDTVESLKDRAMVRMLQLFFEICECIIHGDPLPVSSEEWTRVPYTRKELNELCQINQSMDEQEVTRRVRATVFPGFPGAHVCIGGHKFNYSGSVSGRP